MLGHVLRPCLPLLPIYLYTGTIYLALAPSCVLFGDPVQVSTTSIHKEKIQQDVTMYQNFIIPYLYEAQHVSDDTPPIIRSLKLHWQPLVFHT
jgi:hypothetical protein